MSQSTDFERAPSFADIVEWSNLLAAFRAAAKGKRSKGAVAQFEVDMAEELLALQAELRTGQYTPRPYRQFVVHEAKRRVISAAAFRDRVVHHALVRQTEPILDARFSPSSFANRRGLGTHRAIDRFSELAAHHRYVLRLDIVQYFPSIDHQILQDDLRKHFRDPHIQALVGIILKSGEPQQGPRSPAYFSGDSLFDGLRPRGLPIGNLTSQIWANVYLDALDHTITGPLNCPAYVRYVDDFAFFSNSKRFLWSIKRAVRAFLDGLRLRLHENQAQVMPTRAGVPWLGFVIGPGGRRVKARKVRHFTRRFREKWAAYEEGRLSFAELDAAVGGFAAHVQQADAQGLLRHLFGAWPANEPPRGWKPELLR